MTTASESDSAPRGEAGKHGPTDTFGDRLRAARRAGDLSRGELADKLGFKAKTVKAWERNELEPRPDKMIKLAGLLNVSLKWLLTGDDTEHQGPHGQAALDHPGGLQAALAELRAIRTEQAVLADRLAGLEMKLQHLSE